MARGYLGKISAIVTANTDDFSRRLSGAARDADKWANSVQRSFNTASTNARTAFDNILTPLQKVQRALEGVQKINPQVNTSGVEALVLAAEQLAKPLSGAVKQFSQLSTAVQSGFSPVLADLQSELLKVRDAFVAGGTVGESRLESLRRRVEATTSSVSRLSEVSQGISRLNTGAELRFRSPEVFSELERAQAAQKRALAASPRAAADAGVGGIIEQQVAAARELEAAYSRLEAARARAIANPRRAPGDVAAAQTAVDDSIAELARKTTQLEGFAPQPITLDALGPGFTNPAEAAQRSVDSLTSRIVGVQSALDSLPASVRSQFIPAIEDARRELTRLKSGPVPGTVDEFERLAQSVRATELQIKRAADAERLLSFDGFVESAGFKRAAGELQALQQILLRIGATADGPAAEAYERLRLRTQEAVREGTAGLPRVRRELEQYQKDAAAALAATGRISADKALRQIKRGGDVASGSFQNLGLAIQQGVFAIEDFFSVTGGLDQRIRAAGNNLSQLGFILGGTAGLITGVSLAIGSQLIVALIKWADSGRSSEDRAKALNDTLSKQKSLVDELAQSFRSLGDSFIQRGLSDAAGRVRDLTSQLEDARKTQQQLRDERIGAVTPAVQNERSLQQSLQKQLEGSSSALERVSLNARLEASRRRERDAIETRRQGPAPLQDPVTRRPLDASALLRSGILGEQGGQILQSALRQQSQGFSVDIRAAIVEALRASVRSGETANLPERALARRRALLSQAEDPIQSQIDAASESLYKRLNALSIGIADAQQDVADAIKRGVPNAAEFQLTLDETSRALASAFDKLAAAQQLPDLDARRSAAANARQEIAAAERRRGDVEASARVARLGRTFGGERATQALSALQGNERFTNEYSRITARLAVAVDDESQARRRLEAAIESGDRAAQQKAAADLNIAQRSSELAAAIADAALSLENTVSRIRQITDNALSASEGIANSAQSAFTSLPNAANRSARDRAERNLISDRRDVAVANASLDRARADAMSNPAIMALNGQLENIRQQREDLAAQARVRGIAADPRQMEQLSNAEAALMAQREEAIFKMTAAERAFADAVAQSIEIRRRGAEEERAQVERERVIANRAFPQNQQERFAAADRGRLLARRNQDVIDAANQDLEDIRQYFAEVAELGNGLIDREAMSAAASRAAEDRARSAAPAVFSLVDAVANAVLQGPSRAALQASDISTAQGQTELNRLIRGDDAARNQSLVELQKQSQKLTDVVTTLKDISEKMGITLDL